MLNISPPNSLPQFYYLDHALELFHFVQRCCDHLLQAPHREYINLFLNLPRDQQALQTRILSRKPKILSLDSFDYQEINTVELALAELKQQGLIGLVEEKDGVHFLTTLTKIQLLNLLAQHHLKPPRSTSKQHLVDFALVQLTPKQIVNSELCGAFVVRRHQTTIDYIFYLFFGRVGQQFQRFVMRDLVIMRTRKSKTPTARFDNYPEAACSFHLAQELAQVKQYKRASTKFDKATGDNALEDKARHLLQKEIVGEKAQSIGDELFFQLGLAIQASKPELAIELWQHSNKAEALEKWVRLSYSSRRKDDFQVELQNLRTAEMPEEHQVFIEDFYARKFEGKRTSIFTDMLRESEQVYQVDEVYQGNVEQGVMNQYAAKGIEAFFTENHFWRTLFGLSLWDVLFDEQRTSHGEFDLLPSCLQKQGFYQTHQREIEQCLQRFDNPPSLVRAFLKLCTSNYGQVTGIFRWRDGMLDPITAALKTPQAADLAKVLRAMAKNFRHSKDGYPDLMVIEDNNLRFEEVKAPGDVLRPNQLLSINRIRDAGISVEITQVEWSIDPEQDYAVVDIETTGSRRSGSAITEVAVVKVRNGEIVSEWSSLINPQQRIPRHITQLTGIDNSMVARAPLFSEIAPDIQAQLKGCIFVAHNVGFDYGFLKDAFARTQGSFRYPKLCTVQQSRKAFPGLRSYSLASLTEHFDIELKGHHRALNDARATAHLLRLIHEQRR